MRRRRVGGGRGWRRGPGAWSLVLLVVVGGGADGCGGVGAAPALVAGFGGAVGELLPPGDRLGVAGHHAPPRSSSITASAVCSNGRISVPAVSLSGDITSASMTCSRVGRVWAVASRPRALSQAARLSAASVGTSQGPCGSPIVSPLR